LTADAAYADIVLPATTMFEINSYMTYGPIFRIRDKVIEPVGEARNDFLIMAELANRLGYGDLYPQSEKELLQFVLQGSGFTEDEVRKAGGWVKIPSPMMDYKKWEKGGLRKDGKPGFETPTGKFEIWSTVLEDFGYEPLPKYVEPVEGPVSQPELAKNYPLVFNSGARPQTDFRSQHHGIKGLVEDHPEPVIEINTNDAEVREIKSGDLVAVHTPRGSVSFRAWVTENITPGAIECNMGGGTAVGPKAWREWNVNELTDLDNFDDISGFPVYKALLCNVEKMETAKGKTAASRKTEISKTGKKLFDIQVTKKKVKRHIYLDNNATTEVLPEVKGAMVPFLTQSYGNPSALHQVGYQAREGLEKARRQAATLINAKPNRLIFTGCGSESDNLALKGIALAQRDSGKHIITTSIEHPAILKTTAFLEKQGFRITYLEVDHDGYMDPPVLKKAITPDTILISIMMANNEVGTIQPITELCRLAHEHDIIFHTDAVQAAGKIEIDVEMLDVDLLTLSGHKFHGPKGVGVLYVKKGIQLEPLIHGGKQEKGWRAGTENIPGIVGMGKAAEVALHTVMKSKIIAELRDSLEKGIKKLIPSAVLNGHRTSRLPNTLNLTLPGLRGESLVVAMDQHGVALSSGSACKAGSPDPTHVLLAMGRTAEEAHCSVRFSLSEQTTQKDIDFTLEALSEVLTEMESTVRFLPCK
jgi:cysteine desulfurase NifS